MIKLELSTNYRFTPKEISSNDRDDRSIAIMLLDKNTNLLMPHPITEFITVKYAYSGRSLNSQIVPARIVCQFLNYLYEAIDKKDQMFMPLSLNGLRKLNLHHGSHYISHLTRRKLSLNTVKLQDNVLSLFYVFLTERKYIDEKIDIEYSYLNNKKTPKSLFKRSDLQTQYPSRKKTIQRLKLKDFGKNRHLLITRFIQTARSVAPDIALGVCFQFYGGLRRGEVINITKSDLEIVPYESMLVSIKDNRNTLFSHLQDTSNEFPKRTNYLSPRLCKQMIIDVPLIWEVYYEHINRLEKLNPINEKAFFINSEGNPMSGKVYERRFKRIKKKFLDELLKDGLYEDYILLTESYWSTHIGRGVYTNMLFDMKLSPTQIAIARGDTNINSSMEYVDEKTTINAIKEHLPMISKLSDDSIEV